MDGRQLERQRSTLRGRAVSADVQLFVRSKVIKIIHDNEIQLLLTDTLDPSNPQTCPPLFYLENTDRTPPSHTSAKGLKAWLASLHDVLDGIGLHPKPENEFQNAVKDSKQSKTTCAKVTDGLIELMRMPAGLESHVDTDANQNMNMDTNDRQTDILLKSMKAMHQQQVESTSVLSQQIFHLSQHQQMNAQQEARPKHMITSAPKTFQGTESASVARDWLRTAKTYVEATPGKTLIGIFKEFCAPFSPADGWMRRILFSEDGTTMLTTMEFESKFRKHFCNEGDASNPLKRYYTAKPEKDEQLWVFVARVRDLAVAAGRREFLSQHDEIARIIQSFPPEIQDMCLRSVSSMTSMNSLADFLYFNRIAIASSQSSNSRSRRNGAHYSTATELVRYGSHVEDVNEYRRNGSHTLDTNQYGSPHSTMVGMPLRCGTEQPNTSNRAIEYPGYGSCQMDSAAAENVKAFSGHRMPKKCDHPPHPPGETCKYEWYCNLCRSYGHTSDYCYRKCKLCAAIKQVDVIHDRTYAFKLVRSVEDRSTQPSGIYSIDIGKDDDISVVAFATRHSSSETKDDSPSILKITGNSGQGLYQHKLINYQRRAQANVEVHVADEKFIVLLDTGASVGVLPESVYQRIRALGWAEELQTAKIARLDGINDSAPVAVKGTCFIRLRLINIIYEVQVHVIASSFPDMDIILGMNFLAGAGIALFPSHNYVKTEDDIEIPLLSRPTERVRMYHPSNNPRTQEIRLTKNVMLPPGKSFYQAVKIPERTVLRCRYPKRGLFISTANHSSSHKKVIRLTNMSDSLKYIPVATLIAQIVFTPIAYIPRTWNDILEFGYDAEWDEHWVPERSPPMQDIKDYIRSGPTLFAEYQATWQETLDELDRYCTSMQTTTSTTPKSSIRPSRILINPDRQPFRPTRILVNPRRNGTSSLIDSLDVCGDGDCDPPTDPLTHAPNAPCIDPAVHSVMSNMIDSLVQNTDHPAADPPPTQFDQVQDAIAHQRDLTVDDTLFYLDHQYEHDDPLPAETTEFINIVKYHEQERREDEEITHQLSEYCSLDPEPFVLADASEADIGEDENTPEEIEQVRSVLRKHSHLLGATTNAICPPLKHVQCRIKLKPNYKVVKHRPRRVLQKYRRQLFELLRDMVKSGLLTISYSEWASALVLVLKKDGVTIRMCADYVEVNNQIESMSFVMPTVDDIITQFHAVLWFTSLDMKNGYTAMLLDRFTSEVLTLATPWGLFRPLRMIQGLKNAPSIYQSMINLALHGYIPTPRDYPLQITASDDDLSPLSAGTTMELLHLTPMDPLTPYQDDLVTGTRGTVQDYLVDLDAILTRLGHWGFTISLLKSSFLKKSVEILSHKVAREGMSAQPRHMDQILSFPFPNSSKEISSFVGLLSYYRRYIPKYSFLTACLHALKDEDFHTKELRKEKEAFRILKESMVDVGTLKHTNPDQEFTLILASNATAITCVVAQLDEDHNRMLPVQHFSRVLSRTERRYSALEKEMIALLLGLSEYQPFLLQSHSTVWSSKENFKWAVKNAPSVGRIEKFHLMLSPFDITVKKCSNEESGFATLLNSTLELPQQVLEEMESFIPDERSMALSKPPNEAVELLQKFTSNDPGHLLSFDAATSMKNSMAGLGYVLWELPSWKIIDHSGKRVSQSLTVNSAEYGALIYGLKEIAALDINRLIIVGDSIIVTKQLRGEFQIKNERLKGHYDEVIQLLKLIPEYGVMHAKRNFNAPADHLTKLAMSHLNDQPFQVKDISVLHQLNTLELLLNARTSSTHDAAPTYPVRTRSKTTQLDAQKTRRSLDLQPGASTKLLHERKQRIRAAQLLENWMSDLIHYLEDNSKAIPTPSRLSKAKKYAHRYLMKDDMLCRLDRVGLYTRLYEPTQIVVPKCLVQEILRTYHDSAYGGHFGVYKTLMTIRRSFYWKSIHQDVAEYVKSCLVCQAVKSDGRVRNVPSPGNVLPTSPNQILAFDLAFGLPETPRGNSCFIVCVDLFSGLTYAKAMVNTTAAACAQALENTVFTVAGFPSQLRHDRDQRFQGELFKWLSIMIGAKQSPTLAYRPQADGTSENRVKLIKRLLRSYARDYAYLDWDLHMPALTFAFNTTYDVIRGDTPFYLHHGYDAQNQLTSMLPTEEKSCSKDIRKWKTERLRKMRLIHAFVLDRLANAQQGRIDQSMVSGISDQFEEGDLVWLYTHNLDPKQNSVLKSRWSGPVRIRSKDPDQPHYYELDLRNSTACPIVHASRLKRFFGRKSKPTESLEEGQGSEIILQPLTDDDNLVWRNIEENISQIVGGRIHRNTRSAVAKTQFQVVTTTGEKKWVDECDLDCGDLLYEYIKDNGHPRLQVPDLEEE